MKKTYIKNLFTCALVILFCLITVPGFTQTKKETPQEKILRLEIENAQLKHQNAQLKTQLMQLKKTQAQTPTKPYYRTVQIQQLCEKYPTCKKWAKQWYQKDELFEIKSIQSVVEQNTPIPFVYSPDHKTTTVFRIDFRHSMRSQLFISLAVAHDGKPIP